MADIEKKVANAILQEGSDITIEGIKYHIEVPTVATLIKISELIADLPEYDIENGVLTDVLKNMKNADKVGDIAALLILGYARVKANHHVKIVRERVRMRFSWWRLRFFPQYEVYDETISEADAIKKALLEKMPIKSLAEIISERLTQMQIGDFFVISTSLKGTILTKSTRGVEIQSGE